MTLYTFKSWANFCWDIKIFVNKFRYVRLHPLVFTVCTESRILTILRWSGSVSRPNQTTWRNRGQILTWGHLKNDLNTSYIIRYNWLPRCGPWLLWSTTPSWCTSLPLTRRRRGSYPILSCAQPPGTVYCLFSSVGTRVLYFL